MKDLLLYTADADACAFMRALLCRPKALGIREITYDIERHPLRDSGMIQSGAELTRMKKSKYQKALLMWDHHGSGRDQKQTPPQVAEEIQNKLDSYTWRDNSAVTVLVPELEQWLWFCEPAVIKHCGIMIEQLHEWSESYAQKRGKTVTDLHNTQPKELFEYIVRDRLKKTISPRDFEEIGKQASIKALQQCESFNQIISVLRNWFPTEKDFQERVGIK